MLLVSSAETPFVDPEDATPDPKEEMSGKWMRVSPGGTQEENYVAESNDARGLVAPPASAAMLALLVLRANTPTPLPPPCPNSNANAANHCVALPAWKQCIVWSQRSLGWSSRCRTASARCSPR
jgi:hypothetical protein